MSLFYRCFERLRTFFFLREGVLDFVPALLVGILIAIVGGIVFVLSLVIYSCILALQ